MKFQNLVVAIYYDLSGYEMLVSFLITIVGEQILEAVISAVCPVFKPNFTQLCLHYNTN